MSNTQVIVCCGSGGVGKTTASAALALHWACAGKRVVLLTIDPAKRLADSLGVSLGDEPAPVDLSGVDGTGSLHALMLDAKSTFDGLIGRLAASPERAQRVLDNHYYQFASQRLSGTHEYMAMEKLLQLCESNDYDIVVVDTPPTRQALDFLQAPDRMASLLDDGVLKWLSMPASRGGWRAIELGSELIAKVLGRLLGKGTVEEIAEFFDAFRDVADSFRTRSLDVAKLLIGSKTRFLLVTTPAPTARAEAFAFLQILKERKMPFGGFLINRVLEAPTTESVTHSDAAIAKALQTALDHRRSMATEHAAAIVDLRKEGPKKAEVWMLPDQGRDLHDIADLALLGAHLPPEAPGGQ